jgi:hypothetical protein
MQIPLIDYSRRGLIFQSVVYPGLYGYDTLMIKSTLACSELPKVIDLEVLLAGGIRRI